MANEHPFQHLFETLGRTPIAHAESVNRQAYEILSDILSVPVDKAGRCILLRAARAGHGKTHLLSRIQHQLGATHQFIPLLASFGCRIDAASVIDDTLRCLVKQLPASGGLCVLDLVTRRLFASALQPLVGSGEVPCQDREGALTALRMRPVETFDFHHPNAVTAHWARENFEVLGQRLSQELAQRGGLPVREVAFWVEALFRFASAPLDHSSRVNTLAAAVHEAGSGETERLEALLGLLTQLTRVVLVADDLEGFSSDESAALRFAAFLGGLRQSVDQLDVILSLNSDIWESAFVPRLSGGLADRLSEVVVELEPLKEAEMAALLDSRVPGLGAKVLERIDIGSSGRHARGLIRAAGMAWLKATAMDAAPAVGPAFVASPAPAEIPPPPSFPVPEPTVTQPAPSVEEPAPVVKNEGAEAEAPSAAFTYSPPPPAEPEPVWPAPEFSPPPPVVLEPEALEIQFTSPEPEPSQEIQPDPAASWNPPEAMEEPVAEPPAMQFAQDSPFQAAPQEMAPEPFQQESSVAPEVFQPQAIDSSFQPAPPELEPAPPQNWAPQETFQPQQVESSFQMPSLEPAPDQSQGGYQPQNESPFQPAPHEPYTFNPPPSQNFDQAPTGEIYQESPQVTPAGPPAQEFQAPQGSFQPAAESPFQAAPPEYVSAQVIPQFQPDPAPTPAEPVVPVEESPPPAPADTDRVDDLLRQFRERYGRGSL